MSRRAGPVRLVARGSTHNDSLGAPRIVVPMAEEIVAFLTDPHHLAVDDGTELDHPTDKPHLYELQAVRGRLLPVLILLPSDIFAQLVRDRDLLILASASPREPWDGEPEALDREAHSTYSVRGRDPRDPVTLRFGRAAPAWLIKLGRIAMEVAPPQAFAGFVIHECMHVHLDHQLGWGATRDDYQRLENQAVERACQLGFRDKAAALIDFLAARFPDPEAIIGRLPPV